MDTNHLMPLLPDMAVFVTVVETGSFTAASEKLGVTPSAVSRKISRLEDALSVKLLERTTRNVSVSEAGKAIYRYCRQMIDLAKEAAHVSNSVASKPVGNLRIAVPKAYGNQVLKPHLFSFLQEYPDINLRVTVTDQFVDPIADEVDIIFRLTDKPVEGLVSRVIGKVDLVLCASPEYIKINGIPKNPTELKNHQCIYLGETPSDNQWKFVLSGHEVSVTVDGRYVVNHTEMRLSAIKQGLGIGILPDFSAKSSLDDGSVVRVLTDWQIKEKYQGVITLQYLQSKYLPTKSRVFIDYIIENMK